MKLPLLRRKKAFLAGFLLLGAICLGLFQVWPGPDRSQAAQAQTEKNRTDRHPKPEGWTAVDQARAAARGAETADFVLEVKEESLTLRKHRLCRQGLGPEDIEQDFMLLNSPYVHTADDAYGPVRFMHTNHAANLTTNCAACHHFRPADTAADEIVRCAACHQEPYTQPDKTRVGLKAAYHLQCLGCHRQREQGPVDCSGCHQKKPADHQDLVSLPADPGYQEVTANCLSCHAEEGAEMLRSAHWRWSGPSRHIVGHEREVCLGKGGRAINNF